MKEKARKIDERITSGWERFKQYDIPLIDQNVPRYMKKLMKVLHD